ncbi:MAG: hypothetical protein ACI8TQ_002571 [Planctomycetota bacterium]|jgi:hypothetical protein
MAMNNSFQSADDTVAIALSPRVLRGLFVDLLARPPFEDERAAWTGRSIEELVDDLLGRQEFWEEWLQAQLYYFLLVDNFRPESDSVKRLPAELRMGKLGVRAVLSRIALSTSFDRRNPGADTFVTVVMEQMLGVDVQKNVRQLEIGKRVYEGSKGKFLGQSGSTQSDVVRIAIEDERCLLRFVEREYKRFVQSNLSSGQVRELAQRLIEDDRCYAQLLREWLLSEEYAKSFEQRVELPSRVFARSLHVDLFNKLPDQDEVRRVRSALDGLGDAGPLRSALVRILLDSGKVDLPQRKAIPNRAQWIGDQFLRFYGRPPSESELQTFVDTFRDPACRPETVVYALLTHSEYASR